MDSFDLKASQNTKSTPAGEIPVDWGYVAMNAFGSVQAGRQRSPHHVAGKLRPYLRVANVQDGWIDFSDVKQMEFTDKEAAIYELRTGDILLTEGQSLELVGRPAIYHGEIPHCCFQNTLVRLRPNGYDPNFVFYVCQHLYGLGVFQGIAKQTTSIAHLGVLRFAEVMAPVAPLDEQRKIANILGTWDDSLCKLDLLIKAQERRRAILMQQMLSGTLRLPAFTMMPWQKIRMDAMVARVFRPIEWATDKTLSLVSLRRRCGGLFRRADVLGADYKTQNLHELKANDFLISKRQVSHGAWALVAPEFEGSHVSKEYSILVNTAPERLYMPFFAWLAQTPRMIRLARVASIGVHIEKLIFDTGVFLRNSIRIPATLAEQQQIAQILDFCTAEVRLLHQQRAALKQQKRGLMQKLLTGKIRVKPEDALPSE